MDVILVGMLRYLIVVCIILIDNGIKYLWKFFDCSLIVSLTFPLNFEQPTAQKTRRNEVSHAKSKAVLLSRAAQTCDFSTGKTEAGGSQV